MNNEVKKYLKEVEKHIPFSSKQKRDFIILLNNNISELEERYKIITYEDVVEHFGKPEEVAHQYIASLDTMTLKKKLNTSQYVKRLIIIITVLFLFYTVWISTLAYIDYKNAKDHNITEIEYTKPEVIERYEIN